MACAFAGHFLFGSISVVNNLGLSFFYYFPRPIRIVIVDPMIDVLYWVLCAALALPLATYSRKGEGRLLLCGLAGITLVFSLALLLSPVNFLIFGLFAVVTFGFFFLNFLGSKRIQNTELFSRTFVYMLAFFAAFESSAGLHYIIKSIDQATTVGKMDAGIELQLSYIPYGLIPWLYVVFLFSWAWAPFCWRSGKIKSLRINSAFNTRDPSRPIRAQVLELLDPSLFAALAFAAFVGYYPYFHNPPWLVGTDTYEQYYNPLAYMNQMGILGGLSQALRERHPLALVILYMTQISLKITAFEVIRLAPIILCIVVAGTTWLFVGKGMSLRFGLLTFLLSILSVTTAIGEQSGILANWMALVLWLLFFAWFNLRGNDRLSVIDAVVLFLLSSLILWIHPWTWGIFAASVALVSAFGFIEKKSFGRSHLFVPILVVGSGFLLAFLSVSAMGSSQGWRITEMIYYYFAVVRNPDTILFFWDVLIQFVKVGAQFFSPLYLAVSILGVLYLGSPNVSPLFRRLVIAWVCASAIGSIIVAPLFFHPDYPTRSDIQLGRLMFLTPFQFLAPFGVTLVTEWLGRMKGDVNITETRNSGWKIFLIVLDGLTLALAPVEWRFFLIPILIPASVFFVSYRNRGQESAFMRNLVIAIFLLVAFNSTTHTLSQLLLDPHSYKV